MATQRPAIAGRIDREGMQQDRLSSMISREIASIAALDAALAREQRPDYVVMFRSVRTAKQANIEQMATLIRMAGGVPTEDIGLRGRVLKMQSAIAEQIGGTLRALRAMRRIEIDMLQRYREASQRATGMSAHALRKALGRTLIHCHVLTAHIAQWTEHAREAANLPYPLRHYFAGPQIKVCMRCHLDRPGSRPALERSDPHPYTYICAGCHDDVSREFPADLEVQMDRWPDRVREARVIQQALGRASILNASQTVLHRLSGLAPELPKPAVEKASKITTFAPPPAPDAKESTGVLTISGAGRAESDYVAALFDYRTVRTRW